jgi:hypothetical protein
MWRRKNQDAAAASALKASSCNELLMLAREEAAL